MRKYILSSLLGLFIGACPSFGQHKVIITLNDGTTIEKYVWQVKDITFGEVSPIVVPQPDETTAVDLGLSVKWASFNIGASSEEEKGLLLGWGDITGLNTSRDLNYFPSLYPKGDIVNTKYDFVKTSWGDKWRLPSTKETQELIDKCTWTAVEDENQKVKAIWLQVLMEITYICLAHQSEMVISLMKTIKVATIGQVCYHPTTAIKQVTSQLQQMTRRMYQPI